MIVRYSLDGETANKTGNEIRANLEAAGFSKIGTASFDAEDISHADARDALRGLLDTLESPPGGGALDHLWVYFDHPVLPEPPFAL